MVFILQDQSMQRVLLCFMKSMQRRMRRLRVVVASTSTLAVARLKIVVSDLHSPLLFLRHLVSHDLPWARY